MRRSGVVVGVMSSVLIGLGSSAAAAPSEQDTAWMVAAHQSNLAEIAAGEAAQAQATTDAVRELGAMFIEMHTALDADLTAAATELGVDLPDAPTPEQEAQLAAVEAQTGPAFDTAWLAQQLAAHQANLQMTQAEIEDGSDPTVIALATASTPVVQQHIAALQAASGAAGAPTAIQTGDGGQAAAGSGQMRLPFVLAGFGAVLLALAVWLAYRRKVA